MVPNEWEQQKLDDLCNKIAVGLAISVTPYMAESGTKLIRNQNIKRNKFNAKSVVYITDEFASKNNSKRVYQGDVVAVRTGSNIGEACVVPKEFDGALTFTTLIARPNKKQLVPEYLSTHINSNLGVAEVQRLMAGGGKPNLNSGELKNYKLILPPLPEQRKIALILSTWDKAIATSEKLIESSKQQKKALMQQLLTGEKRLINPETDMLFDGAWEKVTLGSLFSERVEVNRQDLPLLSITSDEGVIYQKDTGRKDTSNKDKSKYRRICVGDIGYNTMRMWQGRSSISGKEGIVSPAYTIVVPNKKIIPAFAGYLFKLPEIVHTFYRHSQGMVSDTWNLKFSHFKKILWSFPSLEEQQKIAQVFTTVDKEIAVLSIKLTHLQQEKKALMQQLLTGKRRVKVEEELEVAN